MLQLYRLITISLKLTFGQKLVRLKALIVQILQCIEMNHLNLNSHKSHIQRIQE